MSPAHRRRSRSLLALALCLTLAASTVAAIAAQGTTLTGLRATSAPGGGVRLILTFSGPAPTAKIYGDGTTSVSILLSGVARSGSAPANIAPIGAITSGVVTSVGDSLNLLLTLKSAVTVTVQPGPQQTLVVDVGAETAPGAGAPGAGAPGAIPGAPAPTAVSGPGIVHALIRLHYADLSEIAGLLVAGANVASNDTFQAQTSAGNFGPSQGLGATVPTGAPAAAAPSAYTPSLLYGGGATGSVAQRVSDNIAIDRRLNAVLVSGPADVVAAYKAFIEKIDVPLGSVMLETQIVELTDTAARDLGIDFTNAAGQLAAATYQSKSLQTGQGAISLQAAVYAEVQRGNGRLIAQPRILALDGTPASIITGDALPIVTSIAVSGVNALQQQVQYVNVGVNLQIQPRISFDGNVTAHVFSAVSSVTGYSQSYPEISQRQASTLATVKDGDSFVIGGLLEKSEIDSLAKIPGIGDIPLIGGFFRVRHRSSSTTNLYIIVTPHIVSYGVPNAGPQATPIPVPTATPTPPARP